MIWILSHVTILRWSSHDITFIPAQDVVDKGQWSDDGEGKWQQSDDGEGKWQQSDDDGRDGQGADDGDDSASFPENSDEDYDELPWFIDEEDISQPPGDGEEFLQMILNAEHREQEQVHRQKVQQLLIWHMFSVGLKCDLICSNEILWSAEI